MSAVWDWVQKSWKAFMPILVAGLFALGAQFVDVLASSYDGQSVWIMSLISAAAVWFKANKS